MEKRLVIIATACALWAAPALAGQADIGSSEQHMYRGGQERGQEHGRGGFGEPRTYGYERENEMRRHGEGDWRYHHAEGMREGCKYITVRQRQGDEIVVRHFRRCD